MLVVSQSILVTGLPVDLETLRLLEAISRSGSLGRAATSVGISQQAASSRITGAERRLGRTLLVRSRAGSALTEHGLLVCEWGRPLLEAATTFERSLHTLMAGASDALLVAASQTVSEALMPRWMTAAADRVRVRLESGNSDWVVDEVRSGRAHLGFTETPDEADGLATTVLGVDELLIVVSPRHAWASKSEPVTAADLASTPLVSRESGSGTRRTLELALGIDPALMAEPAAQLSSTGAIRAAIAGGVGPGVISSLLVEDDLRAGRLVTVPAAVDLRRPFRAVWSAGLSAGAQDLLAVIAALQHSPDSSPR